MQCTPIGTFHGYQSEKYMAPKQSPLAVEQTGLIVLHPHQNFEQAVDDLQGFERIWLLYWFDRNAHWKPKVLTPRGGQKRGVFSTRSPHRPNPIGLSCVPLLEIKGRKIFIGPSDLLEGTPILDIKPYINYADAFPGSKQGWLEEKMATPQYSIEWTELSRNQAQFIGQHGNLDLVNPIELRLSDNPFPFPNHRIKKMGNGHYELSLKTWRIDYRVVEQQITIECIRSGYHKEILEGRRSSRWDDVPLHIAFQQLFGAH